MWNVYLRDTEYKKSGGSAPVPAYAAPLHRADFAGLPPAWIEVAEFDPLLDEGRLYAGALEAAGVPVELHEVKGASHLGPFVFKDRVARVICEHVKRAEGCRNGWPRSGNTRLQSISG